jgi:outer membrane protein OmpA-like peptidoglycan-associated protein
MQNKSHLRRIFLFMALVLAISFVAGCAYYPIKEIADARRARDAAITAGADKRCPEVFGEGMNLLHQSYKVYMACNTKEARKIAADAQIAFEQSMKSPCKQQAQSAGGPKAAFTGPDKAKVNQAVTFDASPSMSSDGGPLAYFWNLGDGSTAQDKIVTHKYSQKGRYTVTLVVKDEKGATDTASKSIDILPGTEMWTILFDFDRSVVKAPARKVLDAIAELMKANPDMNLVIAGNTCSIGTAKYNMGLSKRRAYSVYKYLVKNAGIAGKRIEVKWFGKERPAFSNNTKDGRKKNRRAEITTVE